MSELDTLIHSLEKEVNYCKKFDSTFPKSDDYCEYVLDWIKSHPGKNWCKKNGTGFYDIIQKKEKPFGNLTDATLEDNGIYLIESDEKKLIYVGKGEKGNRILNRVFDHVMPPHPQCPYLDYETHVNSQQMQNTPEIWVEHLIKGRKIRIVLYVGIDSFMGRPIESTSFIEHRVYNDCIKLFRHKPFYNKTIPR
ncbi:hypothetical protein GTO89_16530 [Heliobacterium gestii]|uniref:GIY-YIG domain-containing protein n=1 Tax=Heliomicrobium gestii TaxID=2699 RepID=A0A845LJ85_HELGE|nr:hypothetical protein [Heliomicrobium gestii]MBM7867314.1 hypothetical protein [Heliomicrobium gestii]MZP44629.1 hypothetical protein [Heliomicrobium gestii]